MRTKGIFIALIGIVLIIASAYYPGLIFSFRNFGSEPPAYLKIYELDRTKDTIDRNIYEIIKQDTAFYKLDTIPVPAGALNWNWFVLSIDSAGFKTGFTFRFAGDSLQWKQQQHSGILLFSIRTGSKEIDSRSVNTVDKALMGKLYLSFEKNFIRLLNGNTDN